MSDLISRSALYEKLVELEDLARQRVIDTPTNSPCYQRYVAQLNERTALKHMVFDAPAAYDVDKVVESLADEILCDGCSGCTNCFELDKRGECDSYKAIMKIVKAGVVE